MKVIKLWIAFTAVMLGSFAVLGYFGVEIYRQAPPIPERVMTPNGATLFTGEDIRDGQNVWQSMGGHQVGSIWGHGAYVAPDWSADWLHREAVGLLDLWAGREHGKRWADLDESAQASLQARLKKELRANTYNSEQDVIVVSADRAKVMAEVGAHYTALFTNDPSMDELRADYAIAKNAIRDPERMQKMNQFFWWASWACATERPGQAITYTNNWPAEPLIGNKPSGSLVLWTFISIVVLLAGVGALAWYYAVEKHKEALHPELDDAPGRDPLIGIKATPSMRATLKYFWVVGALLLAQIGLGALTAHYGVEGDGFFGFPLQEYLPYAVTRTWHTQLGIFWIATAWLATGLFVAPAVGGFEPKWQKAGVNFLFVCLLIIVAGSMAGQWLSVQQRLGLEVSFWFGHQGYEYVDLGRFWQIFLFVGLFVWLGLMGRALWPALRKPGENRSLLVLFGISSAAIGLFYGAGLMWGRRTHLAMAEYWRWWVVHLWVEGFFEVFATVVIAFLFTRLRLLRVRTATTAVLFSCTLFLGGGIIGTMHHLYFSGTPTSVMAFGATFSALEIVPLVLIGFEAYENLTLAKRRTWVAAYRWPIYFFVAVAFWNLVGAGLFGFLINPPLALYYMQGLNTTPVHGHTALFGVYGMLGIGLMLFCLRGMDTHSVWKEKLLGRSFWAVNIGLGLMVLLSLLPIGLMQTGASVETGLWYARSAEFLQTPLMQTLRWMRAIGDTVFAGGIAGIVFFVFGLKFGWSLEKDRVREGAAVAMEPILGK